MTKQQRERLCWLKSDATSEKHRLIELLAKVEQISAPQARRLGRIIASLEAWQNS